MDFKQDGHKLIVLIGPDYWIKPDIICPGDCHLWGEGVPESMRADEPCWLRWFVKDMGSEFLEWWSQPQRTRIGQPELVSLADGPIEIEWAFEGYDDDWEMRWRPVAQGVGA